MTATAIGVIAASGEVVSEKQRRIIRSPSRPSAPIFLHAGLVTLHKLTPDERRWIRILMVLYADAPTDMANTLRRVLPVDSDFYIYPLANGNTLEVIVGPRTV